MKLWHNDQAYNTHNIYKNHKPTTIFSIGADPPLKMYEIELKGPSRRGRPLGRWKGRVDEYLGKRGVNGRGVLEEPSRECWDRERWRLSCRGKASEL